MSRNLENKKKAAGRSQVTGAKIGKGARRALNKNADCVDDFLHIVQTAADLDDLTTSLGREALTLGRVTRSTGCGRLEVTALNIDGCAYPEVFAKDGNADVGCSVPICGTLKFKGASRTKTDRANCMCAGDVIILRGGLASGKMSAAAAALVRSTFDGYKMTYPSGFFARPSGSAADADDDVIEWDRSEEFAAEEADVAALRAEAARARALRSGAGVAEEEEEEKEEEEPLNIDAI
jgi:hypothetical protein